MHTLMPTAHRAARQPQALVKCGALYSNLETVITMSTAETAPQTSALTRREWLKKAPHPAVMAAALFADETPGAKAQAQAEAPSLHLRLSALAFTTLPPSEPRVTAPSRTAFCTKSTDALSNPGQRRLTVREHLLFRHRAAGGNRADSPGRGATPAAASEPRSAA